MMYSVSVVVRCLNEERHIGRLLAGLLQQQVPPQQIVIVDSGSTDATLAIASRFPVEIVHIKPEDFSFGRSLNLGCQVATGDIIAIASAHVYPLYDSWLEQLTAPFGNPAVAVAYGRQVGDETTRYSERQLLRRWFPDRSDWHQSHPFSNNANAAIRRTVWETHPYDESLTGLEDLAWAHHALELGHHIAYVAEAPVAHVHWESWSQLVNRYRREAIAHRRIMHDQRMGWFESVRLALANIVSDYIHAARDGQLRDNLISIPWFRSAQFRGTYIGFSQRGEVTAKLRHRFFYPVDLRGQRKALGGIDGVGQRIQYDQPNAEQSDAATP